MVSKAAIAPKSKIGQAASWGGNGQPRLRGRFTTMHFLGLGVILAVSSVVVYMWRTIMSMHREQLEMRSQIAILTAGRQGGASNIEVEYGVDVDRWTEWKEEAKQETQEETKAETKVDAGAARKVTRPPLELEVVEDMYYTVGDPGSESAERRKLSFLSTVGTGATNGCYTVDGSNPSVGFDVSSATACGPGGSTHPCPDCWITDTMSSDVTLTITNCASASWIRGASRSGVFAYTFINTHATRTLAVTDNVGATTYNVPPKTHVQAFCATSLGTANQLLWPSTQVPTLTVDSGLTLVAGNFDASASSGTFATTTGTNTLKGNTAVDGSKTFATGTGAVTINGATTVADSTTFTVGSAGAGGTSTFYGPVTVGKASNLNTLTLHGAFDQQGAVTFSTGTNFNYLNGDIFVAANKDITMSTGTGTFTTGTGLVTINGDVSQSTTRTFTTGSGTVTLRGNTVVSDSKTFTVGSAGAGGASTLYGTLQVGASSNGHATSATVYGHFNTADDGDGTASTFATATGAHTLNGNVEVANNKNLGLTSTSTGTFTTGTGLAAFNGNIQQNGATTIYTGTGDIKLRGPTHVIASNSFTVGSAGTSGQTYLHGDVTMGASGSGQGNMQLTVWGDVVFNNDAVGSPSGNKATTINHEGGITLNGNTVISPDKHLTMDTTGTGEFTTATGPVTINGDTTITGTKKLTVEGSGSAGNIQCSDNPTYQTSVKYCYR